jgi:hypothetical protein
MGNIVQLSKLPNFFDAIPCVGNERKNMSVLKTRVIQKGLQSVVIGSSKGQVFELMKILLNTLNKYFGRQKKSFDIIYTKNRRGFNLNFHTKLAMWSYGCFNLTNVINLWKKIKKIY